IPLNIAEQHFDQRADARAFAVFAPPQGSFETTCVEDDGASEAWRGGAHGHWRVSVSATPQRIDVAIEAGGVQPPMGAPAVLVRDGERRALAINGAPARESAWNGWRRFD